ncbi:MAG: Crp/Fnr family transcriptional regulator, partial [Alphaproteobacteria bacterium]|nr:Crp/Fnr family transcriptional regulator [Alphaproteobacteria bacterium]
KLTKTLPDGRQQIVGLLFPPDFLGRAYSHSNPYTAEAARDWMLLLGRKTAAEKVASFLYMLAKRSAMVGCKHFGSGEVVSFELPLTRADMADYLGLTIETVSRQLTKLKTAHVIRLGSNRLVNVPDMQKLARVAGQEE